MQYHLLSKEQVQRLFAFLDDDMARVPCRHSLRRTRHWLREQGESWRLDAILDEMESMGGVCDCTVFNNCYDDYF